MLKISFDDGAFRATIKDIQGEASQKAAVRALNRTLSQLKTFGQKQIRDVLQLKLTRKDVGAKFRIDKASRTKRSGTLQIRDKGTPLIRFSPKNVTVMSRMGRRKGVSIQEGQTRYVVPGGFIIKNTRSGKPGIFRRRSERRDDLEYMRSMAVGELFKRNDISSLMRKYAQDTFRKNYENDLKYYINQAMKK